MTDREDFVGRMDRLGVARLATAAGLPSEIAERIAQVVVDSGLSSDRRTEVYRELVGHFEDGLASGRTAPELLAAFGDGDDAAAAIRRSKRIVTPEVSGGSGPQDGFLVRLWRDALYAVRRLRARPAFAITAILSLALGIGSNTAIFTLVNDVIFRRPPLANVDQLVDVYRSDAENSFDPISYPEGVDLGRLDVFDGVAMGRLALVSRLDRGTSERLATQLVTGNFFEVLGVRAELGRTIVPDDARAAGEGAVAMISHRYWQRAFAGDPAVIGRTLRLASGDLTIVGVMDRNYDGILRGISIELYVPYTMFDRIMPGGGDGLTGRNDHSAFTKVRLKPGVTLPQARAAAAALVAELRQQKVDGWRGDAVFTLLPTADVILYPPIDKVLAPVATMLMIVVGLVLVIACANLAGFLLARAVDRRKEIAVRLALGASRGQLVSQLLVETTILALVAGGVGLFFGRFAIATVMGMELPLPVPVSLSLAIDWRVLAFSVSISAVAGILFGLATAMQSTRLDLASVIRDETTGGGRNKGVLRSALVMGQVAVAVVLLVAAGLFTRSLDAARRVDPGFGSRDAQIVWVGLPGTVQGRDAIAAIDRLGREVAQLPGVTGVGVTENLHLNILNFMSTMITVDGVEPPPGANAFQVDAAGIDSGYIAVAALELRKGRNVTAFDTDSSPPVAIVNEAFAEKFWPGRDPIGQRYRNLDGSQVEVVGVVNTAKSRSLAEAPRPFVYRPLGQRSPAAAWIMVGTGPGGPSMAAILDRFHAVEPDLLIMETRSMARHMASVSLPIKLGAAALGVFALLALIMASIGLYGTVSYAVAQRSREVGIRLALGADRRAVVRMLLWGGLRLVLAGAAVGLVAGVLFGQALKGFLFGVNAFDPVTLVAVPAVLLTVAGLAAYVPARRAGRVQPIAALKSE